MRTVALLSLISLVGCGTSATTDSTLASPDVSAMALTVGSELEVCDGECASILLNREHSLVVRDPEILERFPLRRVLDQLITQSAASNSADGLWAQWWSSQGVRDLGDPSHHPFCDDDGGTINGFPIQCPRGEELLENERIETHTPVALFNRFDLAPVDGANCGEYRIVYALDGQAVPATIPANPDVDNGRNFVIFEGVLPNPDPSCGLAACLPVAEFWQSLTTEADVHVRADLLEKFYFEGICKFEPVVKPEHYGLNCKSSEGGYGGGCGQIRTNQFIERPWNLREFQLAFDQGELLMTQVSVKSNPFPDLFDSTEPSFDANYVSELPSLLPAPDSIHDILLKTSGKFNAGESIAEPSSPLANTYITLGGTALETDTNNELNSIYGGFPPLGIVETDARATTQSCGGCHEISNNASLGTSDSGVPLVWPESLRFVHVDEFSNLSDALVLPGNFLDRRADVLTGFLDATCGESCLPPTDIIAVKNALGVLEMVPLVDIPRDTVIDVEDTLGGSRVH